MPTLSASERALDWLKTSLLGQLNDYSNAVGVYIATIEEGSDEGRYSLEIEVSEGEIAASFMGLDTEEEAAQARTVIAAGIEGFGLTVYATRGEWENALTEDGEDENICP